MSDPSAISGNPLQAILAVSAALVSSVELEEVFAAVVEKIGQAMSVWSVGLSSYDPQRDVCVFEAWWCEGGITQEDRDYIGTVADLRERTDLRRILDAPGVSVERIDDPSVPALDRKQMAKWGVKTSVDTALRVGDQVIGMMGMEERRFVREFTDIELDLFHKFCELAAIGIHNAMVFRRQRERGRHLTTMIEIGHALRETDDASLFATVAASSAAALDAPRAIVYEYDAGSDTLTPRGTFQREPVDGFDTTGVADSVEGILEDRSQMTAPTPFIEHVSDPTLSDEAREILDAWSEKTCLNAPITYRGEPLGVLVLSWTEQERRLTDDELTLTVGIAEQAAAAIKNARLRATREAGGATAAPESDA